MSNLYRVEFVVRKAAAGGVAGVADQYRRAPRIVLVESVSAKQADILVPLGNNVTLGSGESFDILHVSTVAAGTEGSPVWQ